jgi:N-formylglutamate amidohydrolase
VYFSFQEPTATETPVVVEVPHAGLSIDPQAAWTLAAPVRALGRDADLYVDELYRGAPERGASMLVARASRYVCDLNRAEADIDHLAVEGAAVARAPHGVVWRTTTDGLPALFAPMRPAELERRLSQIHRPYHERLRTCLEEKRERFGFAILLCAHSMPSNDRTTDGRPGAPRADVVPGSRGGTTAAPAVLAAIDEHAASAGLTVRHDDPYSGGFATAHYGRPQEGIHAIQIELARRLYMTERGLQKKPSDFERCAAFCTSLVARLGELDLA